MVEGLEIGLQRNRAQRCFVQSGGIVLRYEATVEIEAEVDFADELFEQNYGNLPAEVLPYVNPSRYCESDLLGNFSVREFGKLEQGLFRVRSV